MRRETWAAYSVMRLQDKMNVEKNSVSTPWLTKIIFIIFAILFAIILIAALFRIYKWKTRGANINEIRELQTLLATAPATIRTQISTTTPQKILLAYAPDVKEKVMTFSALLEDRTNIKLLDLYDTHDPVKLEDPIIWLQQALQDPYMMTVLVSSKEIKRVKEIRKTSLFEASNVSSWYITGRSASEYPTNIAAEKQEMQDKISSTSSAFVTSEVTVSAKLKRHSSLPDFAEECLSEVTRVSTDVEYVGEPSQEKLKDDGTSHEALYFLLSQYLSTMIQLKLNYNYERVYQVRFSNSPTDVILEDITPGRLYLIPEHMDDLIRDIRNSKAVN